MERAQPPAPPPPPPGEPIPPEEEDLRPATLGDVRSLRRWVAVAGVWAVAASAVAIIALLESDDDNPRDPGLVRTRQLDRVEEDLSERIDALETRVEEAATAEDVRRLQRRVQQAETRAADANDEASALRSDVDDLQTRVEELEQQPADTGGASPDSRSP